MRSLLLRLAAAAAGIAIIASCDTVARTAGPVVNGNPSTSTGKPQAQIDSPATTSVNLGDTLLVAVRLHSTAGLRSTTLSGITYHGSADLGTLTQNVKYGPVTVPATGNFRYGLGDTVVKRLMIPLVPLDSSADSLVIQAVTFDTLGAVDTTRRAYVMKAGPAVTLFTPKGGDSLPVGIAVKIVASAAHPAGLSSFILAIRNDSGYSGFDKVDTVKFANAPKADTETFIVNIPSSAPIGAKLLVSATATSIRGETKAVSVGVKLRGTSTTAPVVTQHVGPRLEIGDTISVDANGDGIAVVGYLARDSVGAQVWRDSIKLDTPYTSNAHVVLHLDSIPVFAQGHSLAFTAFAWDKSNRIGYASASGTATTLATALVDSSLIVYGRTYAIPSNRNGVVGDVAVDPTRGYVFLSNTSYNRLELWKDSSRSFDANGVSVGSQPWGMALDNSGNTLFVANSGGTNVSQVDLTAAPSEVLSKRILTRNTVLYAVHQSVDQNGKIKLSIEPPIIYSDRPQYIGQSKAGRLFYSTRPTSQAPAGTIRWLDPTLSIPDPKQIYQYGTSANDTTVYGVFNADSVLFSTDNAGTTGIKICDHAYGTNQAGTCGIEPTIQAAIADVNAAGGDVVAVRDLSLQSLALTDTTFLAVSGDRTWVAFGEGNTGGNGRIMMVNDPDPTTTQPGFFSPGTSVTSLLNNASEHVFGIALDLTGQTIGAHGGSSYFANVENPFHLRLQGVYDSFASGAGIAFHPLANGLVNTDPNQRLAFVASSNENIEVVDIAHYVNRGALPIKQNLYGPLRAALPLAGVDPADVVLKLYGLTAKGLVVIDIRLADIKPAP